MIVLPKNCICYLNGICSILTPDCYLSGLSGGSSISELDGSTSTSDDDDDDAGS